MGSPVVLDIWSSCHESGAGARAGKRLPGPATASNADEDSRRGGVVAEISAPAHAHPVHPVIRRAPDETGLRPGPEYGALIAAVGDVPVRAGAEPAPPTLPIDPSPPLEDAAPHPASAPTARAAA